MQDTTPQAVQACHERLVWLIPQLDKFLKPENRCRRAMITHYLRAAGIGS